MDRGAQEDPEAKDAQVRLHAPRPGRRTQTVPRCQTEAEAHPRLGSSFLQPPYQDCLAPRLPTPPADPSPAGILEVGRGGGSLWGHVGLMWGQSWRAPHEEGKASGLG